MASKKEESEQSSPELSNFIIFNPTLCKKEGQEAENILLFYTKKRVSEDVQVRQVGLCEGMINFTNRFSETPCEVLETKKTRQVYFGPEPDFWMVLTVGVTEQSVKLVSNLTLRALLTTCYHLFVLFYGHLADLMARMEVNEFRAKLKKFFAPYWMTISVEECDVTDHVLGVQYLSIDPNTCLCTQRFINSLQDRHSPVKYVVLLHKDKLVFSGLNKHDTRILYHYLIKILFPAHMETSDMEIISRSLQNMGRYLNGPENFDNNITASRLHLTTDAKDGKLTQAFLLVYNNRDTTLCLMIDAGTPCTKSFYKTLDSFISTNVPTLDQIVSKQIIPRASTSGHSGGPAHQLVAASDNVRYVLYNYDNLAFSSTLHGPPRLNHSFMRVVCDLAEYIRDKKDTDILVKTGTDYWISARKCNSRVLFTLVTQKNSHYLNALEEIKRTTAGLFNRLYFCEYKD